MLLRPLTDRKDFDLQNAQSCDARIMSVLANCRAELKKDKGNTDGIIIYLHVTNLFHSM